MRFFEPFYNYRWKLIAATVIATLLLLTVVSIFPHSIPFLVPVAKPLIRYLTRKVMEVLSSTSLMVVAAFCKWFKDRTVKRINEETGKLDQVKEPRSRKSIKKALDGNLLPNSGRLRSRSFS